MPEISLSSDPLAAADSFILARFVRLTPLGRSIERVMRTAAPNHLLTLLLIWSWAGIAGIGSLDAQMPVYETFDSDELNCDELNCDGLNCDDLGGDDLLYRSVVAAACPADSCDDDPIAEPFVMDFIAEYDNGFRIRPICESQSPYDLKINGWIQFRHSGFSSRIGEFTDSAGTTRNVNDRNVFGVERGRLIFSGHAVDPRLSYFIQIGGNSDGENEMELRDYYAGWDFSENLTLQFGRTKVPGSRLWLNSPTHSRLSSMPLATQFFRPGRTEGVRLVADAGPFGQLLAMIGNNFRTVSSAESTTDDKFTYSVGHNYQPLGDFGVGLIDFESHQNLRLRFGQTYTFSPQNDTSIGNPDDNEDFIRLADGTILNDPDALTRGATVAFFDISLYTVDFAAKYRGWSFDAEGYYRVFTNLQSSSALPRRRIEQTGYVVQGGRFLVPKKWDVNVRHAEARDDFGSGGESAIGTNWYPTSDLNLKVSFDVADVRDSPVNSSSSDLRVGDDGVLFRSQLQAEF